MLEFLIGFVVQPLVEIVVGAVFHGIAAVVRAVFREVAAGVRAVGDWLAERWPFEGLSPR